jgi:hypothetical protein
MATQGKVQSLYLDRNKENLIFPRTKIKAISDDNGVGLDAILSSTIYSNPDDLETAAAPINTDTLGGLPAADYATKVDLDVINSDTLKQLYSMFKKANPINLLDNSDFRNPVNQRGNTAKVGKGVYTIDRWLIDSPNGNGYWDLKPNTGIGLNVNGEEWMVFVQRVADLDRTK